MTKMNRKKMKWNHNLLLGCCVVVLAIICCVSISRPIRFRHEKERREVAVKQRLLQIRLAEEKYRRLTGAYAGSFSELAEHRLLPDSLQYIPFSNNKRFDLAATMQVDNAGKELPLMECGAPYDAYLQGMDANQVTLLKQQANEQGQYPGLKIGDLARNNNNAGNWE